jgi:hypothetical protein
MDNIWEEDEDVKDSPLYAKFWKNVGGKQKMKVGQTKKATRSFIGEPYHF